jgi:hypothetical protein
VTPTEEHAFIAWCVVKFDIQGPGWWKTCADDLPEHAEAWRASQPQQRASPGLPDWCEHCNDGAEAARYNAAFRNVWVLDQKMPCPDCHPDAATAA